MNEPEPLQQVDRTSVLWKGRKYAYFAGCDYFRMASHPEVLRAVKAGLEKYGLNVAASRITTGNHVLYHELETAVAKFFGSRAALVVSNGYATNSVVAQALRGQFSHVLIDAKSHVSLRDASQLFSCPVIDFKNRDVEDFRRALRKCGKNAQVIVLTDGVYTYEGQVAPLVEYLKLIGPGGMILLDDAHGAGVVGKTGRGTIEVNAARRDRIIQTLTLSKAFGVYGGVILCSPALRKQMIDKSAMFAGCTPLPLPLAYGALRSVKILKDDKALRRRLEANVNYLKNKLRQAGYPVAMTPVPVAAITPSNAKEAATLRRRLMKNGVFPSFIVYPGGPVGGYLRIVISSEHTRGQMDALLDAVR